MSQVSRAELDRAVRIAKRDFASVGLYSRALEAVPVYLTRYGDAYGYCTDTGEIEIPAFSWSRLVEERDGEACELDDVVRHELAHALAHHHLDVIDTPAFAKVFGAAYWDEWLEEVEYDPREFVTEYATTAPCEDFADTMMVYARHRGRVALRYASRPGVMRAFRYCAGLARDLRPYRDAAPGVPRRRPSRRRVPRR